MEKACLENLRAVAGSQHHAVSWQSLELLCRKHGLTDAQRKEVIRFCREEGIRIFDEVKEAREKMPRPERGFGKERMAEREQERRYEKLCRYLAGWLVYYGMKRTREEMEQAGEQGRFCGTYTSSLMRGLAYRLRRSFSLEELSVILSHLPASAKEERGFALQDEKEPERCQELNRQLDEMIPKVLCRRTRSLKDYLD